MTSIRLRESIEWSRPRAGGVFLGEAVKELGLDPERYLAVIPGEAGRAGRVNHNGRIYPIEETIREHERLCLLARETFQEVYMGHPETQESWDVACRLFGGTHRIEEDGSAVMEALFAIPNTDLGRRVFFLWEEGLPIGVSSRAMGSITEHVIDESSPFYGMNPDHAGQSASLVGQLHMEGYDVVRVPSADVYLTRPDIREAICAVREAVENRGDEMSFKNLKELREGAPDLAKEIDAEIAKAVEKAGEDAKSKLSEAEKRADKAEVEAAGLREAVKGTEERLAVLEGEAKKAKLRSEIDGALREHLAGKPVGDRIHEKVLKGFEGGRITSVDEAVAEADEFLAVAEAAAGIPRTQVDKETETVPAPEGGEGDDEKVNESAPSDKVAALFG